MIDLVPNIQFTDTEKQVYGSIAGALLGALIGSIATFMITRYERRKQNELHKIRQNQSHIHECAKSLQRATMALTDIIMKCDANSQYVADIKKGLIKHDDQGRVAFMQAATPFEYLRPEIDVAQSVLNDKIVALWANLCQEIELQNKSLNDFATFYKGIFEIIHNSLLRDEKINVSVVNSDNATIMMSMERQLDVNAQLKAKCLDVLLHIDCFNSYIGQTDIRRFKHVKQYRVFIGEMSNYVPTVAALDAVRRGDSANAPKMDPLKKHK